MRSGRLLKLGLATTWILSSATGCATSVGGTEFFCELPELPIRASSRDTPETLDQVDRLNAIWMEVCRG